MLVGCPAPGGLAVRRLRAVPLGRCARWWPWSSPHWVARRGRPVASSVRRAAEPRRRAHRSRPPRTIGPTWRPERRCTIGAMTAFHVDSEVGVLRRVLLHRPDLELRRLTPSNCQRPALRRRAVGQAGPPGARRVRRHARPTAASRCSYVGDLLAETVKDDVARRWLLDRVDHRRATSVVISPIRRDDFFDAADPTPSPPTSSAGSPSTSCRPGVARGLARRGRSADHGFVLPPLPNHLFTRDTTCWIYGGVSLNPMAMPARRRETAHLEAIYRFHPLFAGEPFATLVRRRRRRPRFRHHRGRRRPRRSDEARCSSAWASAPPRRPSRPWPATSSPAAPPPP